MTGQSHVMPAPSAGWEPSWRLAFEVADNVDASSWMLVGGLMVQLHAHLAQVPLIRATDDVDMVVELSTATYSDVAAKLRVIGFEPHQSLDGRAPFHRLVRNGDIVDLMVPDDGKGSRQLGRPVLQVPGSRSALRTAESVIVEHGGEESTFRIPSIAAAIALKGGAYASDTRDRDRHLQDGIVLFACSRGVTLQLSTSMRRNVNHLVNGLAERRGPWRHVAPEVADAAEEGIRNVRSDWARP